jgi:hypothetical protein
MEEMINPNQEKVAADSSAAAREFIFAPRRQKI